MIFMLSQGFSIPCRKLARVGFEPTTSCLPCTRSNHWAIWPNDEMCLMVYRIKWPRSSSQYKDDNFKEKILQDLAETGSKLFRNLKNKGGITEKQLKYFMIDFKKATNLGKLYLLPKIHKRLFKVPVSSVISNCGTPTEKSLSFWIVSLNRLCKKVGHT